jgi:hypothetical protein
MYEDTYAKRMKVIADRQHMHFSTVNFHVPTLRSPPVIIIQVSILHIFLIVCGNGLYILKMPEYLISTLCPLR